MTGDQQDVISRLKAVLPVRWFADVSPVLDGLLAGLSWAWSWALALLAYARLQTRIATATDVWLDMIAQDFFGHRIVRRPGQQDDAFRRRVLLELVRERGTRAGVAQVLSDLTGRAPIIFEPARTTDTGAYGSLLTDAPSGGGLAYGAAGGWGSLALPFQAFVTAFRPLGSGIAGVIGWGSTQAGYGAGPVEYASLDMLAGAVTDADIYASIADVMPVSAIAWTAIAN
jgi:hypothetical protein